VLPRDIFRRYLAEHDNTFIVVSSEYSCVLPRFVGIWAITVHLSKGSHGMSTR
jgi:hypothetical protein